jgi:hypothetical protein
MLVENAELIARGKSAAERHALEAAERRPPRHEPEQDVPGRRLTSIPGAVIVLRFSAGRRFIGVGR